jgi:hypothetical protein
VAATLKREMGLDAKLTEGDRGEFTIWVDKQMVAKKGWLRFPGDEKVLTAVRAALQQS